VTSGVLYEQLNYNVLSLIPNEEIPVTQFIAIQIMVNSAAKWIASPFDILRTRMVVQTTDTHSQRYKSVFSAIQNMFMDEGLTGLYCGLNGICNAVTYLCSSVVESTKGLAMAYFLGLNENMEVSVLSYLAFELGWDVLGLITLLPLQTIQRRSHLQLKNMESFETIVPLNRRHVSTMYDMYQLVLDENKGSHFDAFYRGFSARLTGLVARKLSVFAVQILAVKNDV
jgi:hypothetical protein